MTIQQIACLSGLVLLLSGCLGASTNPREGGLFGYSPEAYEQRQQEREAKLAAIENEQRREAGQTSELETQRTTKARTVSQQQKELQAVEKNLSAATKKLNATKAANAGQEARLNELRNRATGLEKATVKASSGSDSAARAAELKRLKQEAARLEKDINMLSTE